eukprot:3685507-Prorocentrum_lima.AAC.1
MIGQCLCSRQQQHHDHNLWATPSSTTSTNNCGQRLRYKWQDRNNTLWATPSLLLQKSLWATPLSQTTNHNNHLWATPSLTTTTTTVGNAFVL